MDTQKTEKVGVSGQVEVPSALVDQVAAALLTDHWRVFEGQFDRIDKGLARKVAATAVAEMVQSGHIAGR